MLKTLDGNLLKKVFISAANNLENNKKMVDDLNVFPVPDGDTGTNMSMTVSAAAKQVLSVTENSASKVAECIASASLRGARGNSGVISSQIFRGFYRGLEGAGEVGTVQIANAFKSANATAYKAVMKPAEGTILTVSRETAEYAAAIAKKNEDIVEFMQKVVAHSKKVLDKTPDMLPVLKQAGVVDAGGMGLYTILNGCLMALEGNEVELINKPAQASTAPVVNKTEIDTADIKFLYCTEFIINKKTDYNVNTFRSAIQGKGDCMLVIDDDEVVKVHIHTNHPGFVLEEAVKIGELTSLKIDNMKYQHEENIAEETAEEEKPQPTEPAKKYGMVAVAAGNGMAEILKELGVDSIVEGGQSMNPSTEDILKSVESVNAETVFVFPNNKNIILAAEQVDELTEKEVVVIPTKTIPQGITAILTFDEDAEADDNKEMMIEAISTVKTASITFAARDSEIDGLDIKKDDIMGMNEGKIQVLGKDISDVAMELLEKMTDDQVSMVTVFYGEDVTEDEASALEKRINEKYPKLDCMVHSGGQPLYYYIISLE